MSFGRSKTSILIALVATAVVLAGAMSYRSFMATGGATKKHLVFSQQAQIRLIEIPEIQQKATDQYLFVDARPALFFKRGHIPGALNIAKQYFPRDFGNAEPTLKRTPGKPIVVYCSTEDCEDAMRVASDLVQSGTTNVSVLKGGWKAWCDASMPQEQG